jgi:disulfide bond formation protein DsbB
MVALSLACHQRLCFFSIGYWHGMLGYVEDALVVLGIVILGDWKGSSNQAFQWSIWLFSAQCKTMTRLSRDSWIHCTKRSLFRVPRP